MNSHPPRRHDGPAGHLVVLGSGPQVEWEHVLQRLAAAGPLLLIEPIEPTWQRSFAPEVHVVADMNPHQILSAVRSFARTSPVDGALTFRPDQDRTVDLLRRELSLPAAATANVEAATLRHGMAQLLNAAGVDNSEALQADTYDQALEAAHQVGFPLVCKPAAARLRYTARRVNALPELAQAFSAVATVAGHASGTVIEPLFNGIEATAHTIDSPAGPGIIAMSHATFDPRAEPALVPLEGVVDADDVCAPAVEGVVSRALSALGHRSGPAQVRLRITSTGPRVLSVSSHLTDPLLSQLIEQVTGIDLITQAGDHARGATSHAQEKRLGAAAVHYLQDPASNDVPASPTTHTRITPYAALCPYPVAHPVGPLYRSGHIRVSGTDYPQCTARLQTALTELGTAQLTV
ncbi:hypothetical protein ABT160_41355 [Streptomyces sp. NPDC001941]|uniref:hypothetical protein n=1 Tax=Streptomyces sp. NPDC001941 TaxID=3154659 RepID=UPI003328D5EA